MYYIGIDLGGTNIGAGLVDEDGKILNSKSIPTYKERGMDLISQDIIKLCKEIIEENNLTKEDINSIGVGTPGEVDTKNGVIVYASNIKVDNFPITEVISNSLDIPSYVANDADCAALGEAVSGTGKGYENAIVITLGTGIGGGVVIGGQLYTGSYPGAGEIGHTVIEYNGRPCACGRKGCFEQYGSATALIRDAKKTAKDNPDSKLNEYVEGDLSKMNAKIPFDAAQAGDKYADKLIGDYIDYLSAGITNLINIFQPEMIILGGGVARQEENLTRPLSKKVKSETFTKEFKTIIDTASLGNDAGIIGAAMLGKK